jgi:3-isopropylmalate dehydrogenase
VRPGSNVPGLFEPVHGSAPGLAGKGTANPMALLRTVGMMLDALGYRPVQEAVESACAEAIGAGETTADLGGTLGTEAAGEAVLARVCEKLGASGALW